MNLKKYTIILFLILLCGLTLNVISATELNETNDSNKYVNKISTTNKTQTQINTHSTKSISKIKTKVIANPLVIKHKKNGYFKAKILKKSNNAKIKNLKINLKLYNGSTYQNYKVKTNKHGIINFNTKNLKIGKYTVKINSLNPKYLVSKSSKIIIGKEYTTTLNLKSKKLLKTKDIIQLKNVRKKGETEVTIVFNKKPKHTIITKAKFYLKNKCTKKTIIQYDFLEFEKDKWDLLDEDFSDKYSFIKVKVWYLEI